MSDQVKNILIGLFTAAALAIIIFMVMFLHPYTGDEGQILRARFTDIDKVSVGTRVLLAGKPVGEVKAIRLLDEIRKSRIERKGDVYVYELELAVDSALKVYDTDTISLRTSGLLGEKSISIDPAPAEPGQPLRIVNDEILYAEGAGSVEETFRGLKVITEKIEFALDLAIDTLQELKERGTWENLASSIKNVNEVTTKFSASWSVIEDALANVSETTANAKEISEKVKLGQGTIGRLLSSEDLYLRTTSLFSKGETILDDINHYGILFHLDKGWQRLRARRMNLLAKLQTPQQFRNFFNDEVVQISTSLSRVGMILDKTESYPCLMEDAEYRKVFAELMRRVEGLEEALKMYNIQIMDPEVKKAELVNCLYK